MEEVTIDQQNEKLYAYEKGFHALHLIHTGTELGVFDKIHSMQEGVSAQALADEMVLQADIFREILELEYRIKKELEKEAPPGRWPWYPKMK